MRFVAEADLAEAGQKLSACVFAVGEPGGALGRPVVRDLRPSVRKLTRGPLNS
jgi:hypothetical protein